MKLARNVGVASQVLDIFVQDATVSTGAGLANVIGSSVSFSWWHEGQASVSTGTASTAGSMGIYSTSAWVQVSSSQALGWYQFGVPDGVFAAGGSAKLHFYGAPSMAPVPVEIDLNAQVNVVDIQGSNAATTSAGVLQVSTQALSYSVNVTSIVGTAAVTSAGGQLQVSTQALSSAVISSVTGSVGSVNGTTRANLIQIYGSAAVTSGAGILNVSTQQLTLSVSAVNVSSIAGSPVVTSAAGQLLVSTQAIDLSRLDVSVSSRLASASYTAPDNTGIANATSGIFGGTALTEAYRSNGAAGTLPQLMYELVAHMGEASITGTTKTINKIDHTTAAETFQLDSSSAPSSIKRLT